MEGPLIFIGIVSVTWLLNVLARALPSALNTLSDYDSFK